MIRQAWSGARKILSGGSPRQKPPRRACLEPSAAPSWTLALARQDGVDYFLVFGTCRALAASFFFWLAAFAFACFCDACLLVAFGDLSPMNRMLRFTITGVNSEPVNLQN